MMRRLKKKCSIEFNDLGMTFLFSVHGPTFFLTHQKFRETSVYSKVYIITSSSSGGVEFYNIEYNNIHTIYMLYSILVYDPTPWP